MWTRCLILSIAALSLTSCASYFKRQSCEEINWFEHGKKVALSGQWLGNDTTLNECRKVDAEISESQADLGFKSGVSTYCSVTHTESLGKSGETYAPAICEGPQSKALQNSYRKGQKDYCDASNGYNAGVSGKKYQNVCPAETERAFLAEYKKGRKNYVQSRVQDLNNELGQIGPKIAAVHSQTMNMDSRITYLEATRRMLEDRRSSAVTAQNFNESNNLSSEISTLDAQIVNQRSELRSVKSELEKLKDQQEKMSRQLSEFKEELATLS